MFKPVSPKVDFPALERRLLEKWYQTGIVKKYLQKNKNSPKKFSFLDGPITANNPMGVHHAWGRTYKDLWQRFKNMQGFCQRFQNGFDCQGLWVEVEVEKELGFKSKKDIEKYGLAKFVEKCKERVKKFAAIQTEQSKRLGYFMDWDNSYYTMSEENNYMIWFFLKKCHEKKLIYKGLDSVPWCPRCGTAISQHEILTEEYQEITHQAIFLKYPLLNRKDEYLLVWTTTPWTLPANVAIAVNPDFTYGKVKTSGGTLIFVMHGDEEPGSLKPWQRIIKEAQITDIEESLEPIKGVKLVGLKYRGPYDDLPAVEKAARKNLKTFHTVVAAPDLVTAKEGTGLVHIAPGAGHEDFVLAKKEKLPLILAIDEEANYFPEFAWLSGKNAANNPRLILTDLKTRGFVQKISDFTHRYPVCWRCKTGLVFRAVDEWYIKMAPLRPKLMAVAKKIRWIPKFGLERELDWLKNMQDWLISKKRYWGLALPIWECQKCGHFEVIGSKVELKEKAVGGWEKFAGQTPHRPWIDEVKIKCQCGEVISRISAVGNPWLDAGIVSFSTLPSDWFPADFITESFPGQFKNWFYSLLVMATVLKGKEPFKTVLGFATLLAEDGRPMHKSLGNAIEFNEGADKIGVDVMRWLYVTQNPAENLLFGYHRADEVRRRFHLMLWNIYNFFITYASIDRFQIPDSRFQTKNVLDRWIVSRLNGLIKKVTDSLEDFDAQTASAEIERFINDLSLWYVRRSRDRVGPTVENGPDKEACYATLHDVLVTLAKLLAPFAPFLAEEIYGNLTQDESVHLLDWPKADAHRIDELIHQDMEMVRKIVELGHAERKRLGVKVRQPLQKFTIYNPPAGGQFTIEERLIDLIRDELNVKDVALVKGKGGLKVEFDAHLTPKLRAEGQARELVRQIQELRKKEGCALGEKITVYAPWWPEDFEDYLKKETLAEKIFPGKELRVER